MRENLPVVDRERIVPPGETLVSTTDLKGRIEYANAAFIEVSGFGLDELVGKAHNIVRHPDMPPQAFSDLWETIAAGHAWTALVKNRCKDGAYYWVRANVTPLLEGGRVRAYLSVRTAPERSEIAAAEELYRAIREGRSRARVVAGEVVYPGLDALRHRLSRVPLGSRMTAGVLAPLGAGAIAAAVGVPLAGVFGLAATLGIVSAWWLRRTIADPIRQIARQSQAMASGRLGALDRSTHRGEVGRIQGLINQLGVNMLAMIRDVHRQADGIRLATTEIATGNQDLSERTEQTASNLQQTASSMDQLIASVRQNAEHAGAARGSADEAVARATESGDAASELRAMMRSVSESASRIGEITQLIDTIAFQTNILALNASVEAARAGEAGRGFSVVADEVRNLARQAAEASGQIKSLVEDSVGRVEAGAVMVDSAVDKMTGIVDDVRSVCSLISDISRATDEQARGIEFVHGSMASLDNATSQNAALVEQSAAAAASLREQADRLTSAVSLFRVD